MHIDYLSSPIGLLQLKADEKGITNLTIVKVKGTEVNGNEITKKAKDQLNSYFKGKNTVFDLPLNLESGSHFYRKVWGELLKIPFGKTLTYLEIAKKLGDPKATRAVGMANGKNPIAIVVPCHRVIGSDGSLTGYAHGVDIKRKLLALENPKEFAINGTLF
jgi:methylated-DNA-[protein]-cysteine S-methyltransferase